MVRELCCAVLVVVEPVYEFHFARYYGNHMVLQRAPSRAVIWGYGPVLRDINTSVEITVDNNLTHRLVYHTIVKSTGSLKFTLSSHKKLHLGLYVY